MKDGLRVCASINDQLEVPAIRFEDAFLLQLREFHGHGGAVYAEIVGELLPVKGDVKGKRCLSDGFRGKVREKFLPGRALADVRDSLKSSSRFASTLTRFRISFW